jgi:hypothetical protein
MENKWHFFAQITAIFADKYHHNFSFHENRNNLS